MKRKLFLLGLLLMFIQTKAQTHYTHTASTTTYTDLEDPISLNDNQVWYNNQYGPFEVPFSFKIAGQTITHFSFRSNNFEFLTGLNDDSDTTYLMIASGIFIQDKNYDEEISQSPISYKVIGSAGSRVLKMEVKNAGSTTESNANETNSLFLNFQVWIYEATNIIEYHYGDSNINSTAMEMLVQENQDPFLIGLGEKFLNYGGFVYGDPASLSFAEVANVEENELGSYKITSYPVNGTLYRFIPSTTTVGTEQFNKTQFRMYPNPVTSILKISLEKMDVTDYIITDMTGKTIQKGIFKALENTIEVGNLSSGMYCIRIGNSTQKFIKK